MQKDMMVTLWESRPVFKKEKVEGDDMEVEKVQIDPEFKIPIIETINRGVSSNSNKNINFNILGT